MIAELLARLCVMLLRLSQMRAVALFVEKRQLGQNSRQLTRPVPQTVQECPSVDYGNTYSLDRPAISKVTHRTADISLPFTALLAGTF